MYDLRITMNMHAVQHEQAVVTVTIVPRLTTIIDIELLTLRRFSIRNSSQSSGRNVARTVQ